MVSQIKKKEKKTKEQIYSNALTWMAGKLVPPEPSYSPQAGVSILDRASWGS